MSQPFDAMEFRLIGLVLFRIVEDDMPPLPDDISPALDDFLRQCFIKNPRHRPSAAVLFEHPWIRMSSKEFQQLRPQDSVPFLRRMSMGSSRPNSAQIFNTDVKEGQQPFPSGLPNRAQSDPPTKRVSQALSVGSVDQDASMSSRRKTISIQSDMVESDNKINHAFVKTSFGSGK